LNTSLVLLLILAVVSVSSQCPNGLESCGADCYNPSQYTCFDGLLCPVGALSCGSACYSPLQYSCVDGKVVQKTNTPSPSPSPAPNPSPAPSPPSQCGCASGLSCCGTQCYPPSTYTCFGTVLCPSGMLACGGACYSPQSYSCCSGSLCPLGSGPSPSSPSPPSTPPSTPPPPPSSGDPLTSTSIPAVPAGWKSVFEDEFNGKSIDTNKWNVVVGDGCPEDCSVRDGFSNDYTAGSVSLSDGIMRLTASRIPGTDRWHSGRISTYNTFPFKYGRVDFRARIQTGDGPFGGLNIMDRDGVYGPWPLSGEINMLKYNAAWKMNGVTRTSHAFHFADFIENRYENPNVDQFQQYSLIWDESVLVLYAGSNELLRYQKPANSGFQQWPFDQSFFLYITLNIDWNQGPKAPANVNQYVLEVDWIRISKRN